MSLLLAIPAALAATTVLCAVGAPRLWLCGIAALVLPPVAAFAVSLLGALAGNHALFAACRTRTARRVVDRIARGRLSRLGRPPRLHAGISGVVLLRQAPGPGAVTTILLSRAGVCPRLDVRRRGADCRNRLAGPGERRNALPFRDAVVVDSAP